VTWTPDAQALLAAVPEFMRPITRRICEELVAEQGATRITAALIHEAEAQAEAEAGGEPVPGRRPPRPCSWPGSSGRRP